MNPLLIRRRGMIGAQGGGGYTPADYVQNGLIHMWDGEYNNGNSHSPTLSSWKDLVGNIDLDIYSGAIIGDKYIQNIDNNGYIAKHSSVISCKTIQFVFKRNSFDTTRTTFVLSNKLGGVRYSGNFHFNGGNVGYLYCESLGSLTNRRGFPISTDDMGVHSISASWSSNTASASYGYDNTLSTMVANLGGSGREGASFFLIGNSALSGAYWLSGNVYCVRLYNRVLTAEEIISNQQIDLQRFS